MNLTTFRKPLAGIVLAGGLLVSGAGIASAETGATGSTAPEPATEQVCLRAAHLWDRLETFDDHLHDHYRQLVERRDKAAAAGHTDLAAKLTVRLEKLADRHERVEAAMVKIHDKVADKCAIPDVAPTPLA